MPAPTREPSRPRPRRGLACAAVLRAAGPALAAALVAGPAVGQEAGGPVSDPPGVSDPGVVFNFGGGVGNQGMAGILALGLPMKRGELVVRSGGTTSMAIFGPSEGTADMGLLYGVRKVGSRGWARVAGGAGVVVRESSVARTGPCPQWNWLFGCGYEVETRTGVGLLGQVDAVLALHPKFGLGLTLYGGVGQGAGGYGALGIGLYFGRAGLVAATR